MIFQHTPKTFGLFGGIENHGKDMPISLGFSSHRSIFLASFDLLCKNLGSIGKLKLAKVIDSGISGPRYGHTIGKVKQQEHVILNQC